MSIYTRSYMRPDEPWSPRSVDMVKWILIVLVSAFVLQKVVEVWIPQAAAAPILGFLQLDRANLFRGFIHTPVTYALLHGGFLHILFNGLAVFFAGRALQQRLGPTRVLEVFLLSIVAGGLFWLFINTTLGRNDYLWGASAGVFGLLSLFALFYWHETIRFFFWFIPVSLRGQQIFLILLGLQVFFFLFSELAPQASGRVAYSAHLAGFGIGYLYFRYFSRWRTFAETLGLDRSSRAARARRKQSATKRSIGRYSVNVKPPPAPELRREIDRILDKINTQGFGSLSEEEKQTLDRAKDALR